LTAKTKGGMLNACLWQRRRRCLVERRERLLGAEDASSNSSSLEMEILNTQSSTRRWLVRSAPSASDRAKDGGGDRIC
jgi:hypothetical protein